MPPFTADYFCHSDHSDNDSSPSDNEEPDPFEIYDDTENNSDHSDNDENDKDENLLPFPKELEPWSELIYDRTAFRFRKPENCFVFTQGVKEILEPHFKVEVYCLIDEQMKVIKHFLLCFVDYPDLFLDIFGFRSRNELQVSYLGSSLIPWDTLTPSLTTTITHNFSTNTKDIKDLSEFLKSNKNF